MLELSKTPAHMSGSQSRRLLVWYTLAFVPSTRSAEDPESMFTFNIFQPNVFPKKYPKISENVPKMHFASGINSETGGMIMGGSGIGGVQWWRYFWIFWRWLSSCDLIFFKSNLGGDQRWRWYCASELSVMWCIFKFYKVLKVFNSGSWPVLPQKILLAVVPSPTWLYKQQWRYLHTTQKQKHRKNCESCPSQVTWKVKIKCQICVSCLSSLTCLSWWPWRPWWP